MESPTLTGRREYARAMLSFDTPITYLRTGVIYLVLSFPAWGMLVTGQIMTVHDVQFLVSLVGLPLGGIFLYYSHRKFPLPGRAGIAVRIAFIDFVFVVFLGFFYTGFRMGVRALLTAVEFCEMAAGYLALLTAVFAVASLFQDRPASDGEA